MVLRQREGKMASDQPLKKRLRRGSSPAGDEDASTDETDFISRTDLSALHLSLPSDVNEDDLGHFCRPSDDVPPDIITSNTPPTIPDVVVEPVEILQEESLQSYLVRKCCCGVSEEVWRQLNVNDSGVVLMSEWPSGRVLGFLSQLQVLFDVYLKQNNSGHICAGIVGICDTFIRNEYNLIEQIIALSDNRDKYVTYIAAKVLSSFLIIAKTDVNNEWLETIINFLTTDSTDYVKLNFSLEIIRHVVEWKHLDGHVLEETETTPSGCTTLHYSDADSYDTSGIKGLVIKSLESKWPELVSRIQGMISNYTTTPTTCVPMETCILTFLGLWEGTISVKANLSVIDTKPFYAHLESFVGLLSPNLSPVVWTHLLSLFNEVLCYGSTLALQDMLPEDTCQLAHLVVRYVKDFRLLDSLPYRRAEGFTVNSFVGPIPSTRPNQSNIDRTLLQKMTLLVLKSVAITVKETRSDSSDSSVGSEDYDFSQDMQLIARSIRDVLKKVDSFIKSSLEFHPETPFSRILIRLFSDQDDYMIESMVCCLDIITGISYQNVVVSPDFGVMLNPVHSFVEFLHVVAHDSDVLLDYLVSNETCFLLYLLRFLKYVKRNWTKFMGACSEGGGGGGGGGSGGSSASVSSRTTELDRTMTVLRRLKMQIDRLVSKDLFPYNINPVRQLLDTCDNLYEGNEYSSSS